ncbi:S26 family signal peptidase [Fluviicola taffensis]|uniref:Signal peptidase I n=1 Tax=Fluviicola taffensis (strain DSM 16823 / NCIMB 13979 / RW262) TaxID=755732 RepID=F2IDY1_FLUTR|nr:S26 family signal peptidase [Fluviicola taffensis]AEA45545.1 signal peptidase I [Fluviicola taffensis DSM 16823]
MEFLHYKYYLLVLVIIHPILSLWWKSFERMGAKSWQAFIPVYNYYIVFKFGSGKPWWSLLMFVPGIHIIMWMVANLSYIRRFGFFSVGDTLQGIFFPYLILWKIANATDETLPVLAPTNWASPVEVAKRTNSDHVTLFLILPVIGHIAAYVLSFRSKRIGKKSAIKEWGDSIIFALVAASIIRTYVFEPFQIPTGSMEKTLLVGDFLFVNKLSYGPKVPVTPFSFPLAHNTIPFINVKSYLGIETANFYRLPGFGDIQRNDVMVFNYPSGDTAVYDPRVPDGLMGHDYHGILIEEAKLLFSEKYAGERNIISTRIYDSITQEFAKNGQVSSDPAGLKSYTDYLAVKGVIDSKGAEFIRDFEKWKAKARIVLSEQKIAHTGEGIIKHYGLIYRPVDKRENYIKRCVGLPGDELEIKKSVLYVNGKVAWKAPYQNIMYYVLGTKIPGRYLEDIGLSASPEIGDYTIDDSSYVTVAYLTREKLAQLKKRSPNTKFEVSLTPQYSDDSNYKPTNTELIENLGMFPKDFYINNTVSDFTKFRIPAKGAVVKLSGKNIAWYRRIITAYEGHKLQEKKDGIYIDGKKVTSYKFAMNYYWLMGDNRYKSADSRVWGFVPEDHVVGKASIVWFSKGAEIRWDRIFKAIR